MKLPPKEREIVDSIKKALLSGGVVMCRRGQGKSLAIGELLSEDPAAYAITTNSAQCERMRRFFPMVAERIILHTGPIDSLPNLPRGSNIFWDNASWSTIDRLDATPLRWSATITSDFQVHDMTRK